MNPDLSITGVGAVTAVGLSALQSCAAIRAKISGFREFVSVSGSEDPLLGAPVPVRARETSSEPEWLARLAARALGECLGQAGPRPDRTALFVVIPEADRDHPILASRTEKDFLEDVQRRCGVRFAGISTVVRGGHAAVLREVGRTRDVLSTGQIDACILGAVDSLLGENDIDRLRAANRVKDPVSPQGLVPGEASAFVCVTRVSRASGRRVFADIRGVGEGIEQRDARGADQSTGLGLYHALKEAAKSASCPEADISFRVSDMNGERYRGWECFLASNRFYRTRRERLPTWYPAASVGDIGAAAGALTLVAAAVGIARGYAPGPIAMCEGSSDDGLRAACLIGPTQGARKPPFAVEPWI